MKKKDIPPNIYCEHAQLCVGNFTHDTIFYGWGINYFTDTLLSGGVACIDAGLVHIEYDKRTGEEKNKGSSTWMINSSQGSWFINVEKCNKRSNFEYDVDNPSSGLVRLYAE